MSDTKHSSRRTFLKAAGAATVLGGGAYLTNKWTDEALRDNIAKVVPDTTTFPGVAPGEITWFAVAPNNPPKYNPRKLDIYNNRIEMTIERGDRFVYVIPNVCRALTLSIPDNVEITLHDFKRYNLMRTDITDPKYRVLNMSLSGLSDKQLAEAKKAIQGYGHIFAYDYFDNDSIYNVRNDNRYMNVNICTDAGKEQTLCLTIPNKHEPSHQLLISKSGQILNVEKTFEDEIEHYLKSAARKNYHRGGYYNPPERSILTEEDISQEQTNFATEPRKPEGRGR